MGKNMIEAIVDSMWDEIDAELERCTAGQRQPVDIDRWQIAERYGMSERQVFRFMDKLVSGGEWESLRVFDPDREHVIRVIRKKDND